MDQNKNTIETHLSGQSYAALLDLVEETCGSGARVAACAILDSHLGRDARVKLSTEQTSMALTVTGHTQPENPYRRTELDFADIIVNALKRSGAVIDYSKVGGTFERITLRRLSPTPVRLLADPALIA